MDKQKDPQLNRQDELKAENNVLKLKLGLEHGMQMEDTPEISPDVENQWLKSVYAFEQQFRDAKRTTLYEYLGRPPFMKWDTLNAEDTSKELLRVRSLMADHDVELDCVCEYDDAVIYRFITEELFAHDMDDMRVPGMTWHFVYEEFYPNHDYDVRHQTCDFIDVIFARRWEADFHEIAVARKVSFSGRDCNRAAITSIITAFQEAHTGFEIEQFDIAEVVINPELTRADVSATLSVSGKMRYAGPVHYQGACAFHFIRENNYWYIADFYIPGLTRARSNS